MFNLAHICINWRNDFLILFDKHFFFFAQLKGEAFLLYTFINSSIELRICCSDVKFECLGALQLKILDQHST